MMKKVTKSDGVFIFRDKNGDYRLRVVVSGRITYSSSEGYKNKGDMLTAALNSAQKIIDFLVTSKSAMLKNL